MERIDSKDMIKKELEQIRPNIKNLINQLEMMKSPYTKAESPKNLSEDSNDFIYDSEKKENVSKENITGIIQVNIDNVKNL